MFRTLAKATAAIAVVCTVAGAGLVLNEEYGKDDSDAKDTTASAGASFTGTKKMDVDGRTVNVSCSGHSDADRPLVMLMPGGGEGLDNMAARHKLPQQDGPGSAPDRLDWGGAGATSPPPAPRRPVDDAGGLLTKLLDDLAGDRPVVLAGHSLGGYIAARYTPDHTDRVEALVLLDATVPRPSVPLNTADTPGARSRRRHSLGRVCTSANGDPSCE
ncbi:hypothetical protein SVIOM342S_07216 [Streptomyces violaceorubidus]